MTETLLIELLTEELPPKALKRLSETFAALIAQELHKAQLTENAENFTVYATPRRLAVSIANVAAAQSARQVLKKGPAVAAAVQDGAPGKALQGFARSCQVEIADLKIVHDGKQEVYAYEFTQEGQSLGTVLAEILPQIVKKLPIPKVMHWGSHSQTFVRPVHGLILLHGAETVSGSLLGLEAGNQTRGHRFMSAGAITITHADDYAEILRNQGKVIASFAEREKIIQAACAQLSGSLNATPAADAALLEEVAALTEYPVVLQGTFDEKFLEVPQECLILTMQQNQKYFPLLDAAGRLIHHFLLVANLESPQPEAIVHGNERVLRARLADAAFFYAQDKKHTLESRLPKLANVVYHNQLGSQADRVARLVHTARAIAAESGADAALTERAVRLAKADLLTEMVGEFPELQGTMGKYYAQADGENAVVADALEAHYRPRFAGDDLPQTPVATAVALADKLETLVGIRGIGLIPTGDKDPFALRRAALGVLRMLMRDHLNARKLIQAAFDAFPAGKLAADTVDAVAEFMHARLAVLLQNDYAHDEVAAVLAVRPADLGEVPARLAAVSAFKKLPEAAALAAANKRVHNILRKNPADSAPVQTALLQENAEKELFAAAQNVQQQIDSALAQKDFQAALHALASLRGAVDAFFENVMVMAEDEALRRNRLALLQLLAAQMNAVADISRLEQ